MVISLLLAASSSFSFTGLVALFSASSALILAEPLKLTLFHRRMEGGSNDCALLVTTRSPASISAASVLGPGERLGERDSRLGEFCGDLERDDALERDTEGEL